MFNKDWINPITNCVDAKAFYLRLVRKPPLLPETNISTAPSPDASRMAGKNVFGVVEITVKDIRDLGLNPIQNKPDHIGIWGIPHDEERMKDYAKKLARKARLFAKYF